jgi:hypothetical protein
MTVTETVIRRVFELSEEQRYKGPVGCISFANAPNHKVDDASFIHPTLASGSTRQSTKTLERPLWHWC